jgi:hypothetical protein
VYTPYFCTNHSHVTRYLPVMNRCEYAHIQHNQIIQKHQHHDPPHLPVSSGFNLIGECNCCKSRDRSQSLPHGGEFFYVKLTVPLYYWLLFCRKWISALSDLRWAFEVNTLYFSLPLHQNNMHWPPQLSADSFFADVPQEHIMFWCDFVRGGMCAIVAMLSRYDR